MSDLVLVINAGSSSLKYQLLDAGTAEVLATGLLERIGQPAGRATHRTPDGVWERNTPIADHAAAFALMLELFAESGWDRQRMQLLAVGHRVVHGGSLFRAPVIVDDAVLQQIRDVAPLAPLHNPANIIGLEQAMATFPEVAHVAVFDTAFFADLPAAAATYALDTAVARKYRVRRYGFHGTSHEYVSGLVPGLLGRDPATVNQIVLHLGNGASVSAIRGGRPVETSMGMTPLEGLVMGTRSGDVDPGVLLHLLRTGDFTVEELDQLLNRQSGVLGLAGISDFRDLADRVAAGDEAASLALDVYCHRIRKYLGAYLAVLGQVHAVTFTAGVGENAAGVRARVLAGLDGLGMTVDPDRNAVRSTKPRVISPDGSEVAVLVVPTNEELAIARAAAALVRPGGAGTGP